MVGHLAAAATRNGPDLLQRPRIQSRACRNEFLGTQGDYVKVRISAAPVDGRANTGLIGFLAGRFIVSESCITLVHGLGTKIRPAHIRKPITGGQLGCGDMSLAPDTGCQVAGRASRATADNRMAVILWP